MLEVMKQNVWSLQQDSDRPHTTRMPRPGVRSVRLNRVQRRLPHLGRPTSAVSRFLEHANSRGGALLCEPSECGNVHRPTSKRHHDFRDSSTERIPCGFRFMSAFGVQASLECGEGTGCCRTEGNSSSTQGGPPGSNLREDVPNEHHRVASHEIGHELGGPSVFEIRPSEVGASQDQWGTTGPEPEACMRPSR